VATNEPTVHPQVQYGHVKPWWNDDVGRGKLIIHQSSVVILPAESPGSKQEGWAKGMKIRPCEVFLFILESDYYTP
jgi:hypothetical protein